jgi:hypothetical protein
MHYRRGDSRSHVKVLPTIFWPCARVRPSDRMEALIFQSNMVLASQLRRLFDTERSCGNLSSAPELKTFSLRPMLSDRACIWRRFAAVQVTIKKNVLCWRYWILRFPTSKNTVPATSTEKKFCSGRRSTGSWKRAIGSFPSGASAKSLDLTPNTFAKVCSAGKSDGLGSTGARSCLELSRETRPCMLYRGGIKVSKEAMRPCVKADTYCTSRTGSFNGFWL